MFLYISDIGPAFWLWASISSGGVLDIHPSTVIDKTLPLSFHICSASTPLTKLVVKLATMGSDIFEYSCPHSYCSLLALNLALWFTPLQVAPYILFNASFISRFLVVPFSYFALSACSVFMTLLNGLS